MLQATIAISKIADKRVVRFLVMDEVMIKVNLFGDGPLLAGSEKIAPCPSHPGMIERLGRR
ncbi:hypothetical protein GJA_4771 [Janthinobacterium agaricidamnosum NBRC 102515 = DSM 9628]|uniref:Uncharacterized protein n=1 Tax=Janthinobacterium agaricidamnosum NBRC 102515 = DSM 9628 TaxID=1349767 RepID=W0VCI0_9BURK|nr:hypothetical protein GJA_4771 [Janthinobacterium agaricidamnosum NBRC 102515 = DSM 9628]